MYCKINANWMCFCAANITEDVFGLLNAAVPHMATAQPTPLIRRHSKSQKAFRNLAKISTYLFSMTLDTLLYIRTGGLMYRTCIFTGNLNLSAPQDSSSDESPPTPVSQDISASSADDEDDEPTSTVERFVFDMLRWAMRCGCIQNMRNRGLDCEPLNPSSDDESESSTDSYFREDSS